MRRAARRAGWVTAGSLGVGCWLAAVVGCTPLGAWVYSDPDLEVGRVRLTQEGSDRAPLLVAITVRNPNDYDLSSARLELALQLDNVAIGEFARDSTVALPKSATAVIVLPLDPAPGATHERLSVLGHGTRHFSVTGRAPHNTPFGVRIVRFAGNGDMVFGST
jgi:hypothetical protein